MTPEQALEVLDNVASKYMGTRQDHIMITQALNVLRELLPKEEPPKES